MSFNIKTSLIYCLAFTCILLLLSSTFCLAGTEKTLPAPNFTLKSLSGEEVSLLQKRGNYVLVNFGQLGVAPVK